MLLLHLVYLRIRGLGLILIHLLITLLGVLSGMLEVEKRLRSLLRRLLPVCQLRAGARKAEEDKESCLFIMEDENSPGYSHSSTSNMDEYSIDLLDPIPGN